MRTQLAVAGLVLVFGSAAMPDVNIYGAVPIVNAGFEDPDTDDWAYMLPNMGWSFCGGNAGIFVQDFPSWAPQGDQCGRVPWGNCYGPPSGFAQLLDATLMADLTYTLTAQVGNDDTDDHFPGYRVELLAGGTQAPDYDYEYLDGRIVTYPGEITGGALLAFDDNRHPPDKGLWTTSTVTYVYDPNDLALVGEKLHIRLLSKDAYGYAYGTAFDAVALDATPEPATLALLALGGLAVLKRRRKP